MLISRIQRIAWVPLQRQHLLASLLSAVAMLVLGLSGFAGFPAFKSYGDIRADAGHLAAFDIALFVANYIFLLRQALPSYLRARRAIMPTLLSLLILSAVAIGLTNWLAPDLAAGATVAPQAQPQGMVGIRRSETPTMQALRLLLVAQGGLAAVILSAGLWKNDDEAVAALARSLRQVHQLYYRLIDGITNIDELRQMRKALAFQLATLIDWLEKNRHFVDLGRPQEVADLLAACEAASQTLAGVDPGYLMIANPAQKNRLSFVTPIVDFYTR
jgi:hypothetical protein